VDAAGGKRVEIPRSSRDRQLLEWWCGWLAWLAVTRFGSSRATLFS